MDDSFITSTYKDPHSYEQRQQREYQYNGGDDRVIAGQSNLDLDGIPHHNLRKTALQWSREEQIRRVEDAFAELSNVGLDVAKKFYTTDPSRLRAEILFQNISRELLRDPELAVLMGLDAEPAVPSLEAAQAALAKGHVDDAKRLLELLQARQTV